MAKVWVLDTETTGFDSKTCGVVEVGGVLLDTETLDVVKTYESLVFPDMPIPPQASAVHHLRDSHVEDAPMLELAIEPILTEPHDYIVAHNAKFDKPFLPMLEVPWICTLKLAKLTWAEAPAYSNQVLRYWLNVPDPVAATYPHRALYDAEVTAHIFLKLLATSRSDNPLERMAEVCNAPILLKKVDFGAHKGKAWSELPPKYLRWVVDNGTFDEDRMFTARYWLERK